jgi:hypothetical protein
MHNLTTLQNVAGGAAKSIASMRRTIDALNGTIVRLESDKSRSREFVLEQVKAEREKVLPALGDSLKSVREAAAVAEQNREFWANRDLLLSRIQFDSDPAVDAALRLRYAKELPAMDLPLLKATQKNALADGNLALVWACAMAARSSGAGALADLSAVEIPQQATALSLIDSCDGYLAEAEMIVAGANGLSMDPVRKLTFARRMQPSMPTSHNSPGREAA